MERLKENKIFSVKANNKFVLEFLNARKNGGYERLMFKKSADSPSTNLRVMQHLIKCEEILSKQFDLVTEDDIQKLRNKLNENALTSKKTSIKKTKGSFDWKTVQTNKPLSYDTKRQMRNAWLMFWNFLTEYVYQTSNKKRKLEDVNKYFSLTKDEDYRDYKVEFIPLDRLEFLIQSINAPKFKALIMFSLATGARPVEALRAKLGINVYRGEDGEWVQRLPNIKRVSYKKFPFKFFLYRDELTIYLNQVSNKLKHGDVIFDYSYPTFLNMMRYYTKKALGQAYSPKILRKTSRMLLEKTNLSTLQKRKFMGHHPDSKIDQHYANYDGVDIDEESLGNVDKYSSPTLKQELRNLKLKDEGREEKMQSLENKQKALMQLLLKQIKTKAKISDSDWEDLEAIYGAL